MEIISIGQAMKVYLHVVAIRAGAATAARIRTYHYNKLFLVTAVWYQIVVTLNFLAGFDTIQFLHASTWLKFLYAT